MRVSTPEDLVAVASRGGFFPQTLEFETSVSYIWPPTGDSVVPSALDAGVVVLRRRE